MKRKSLKRKNISFIDYLKNNKLFFFTLLLTTILSFIIISTIISEIALPAYDSLVANCHLKESPLSESTITAGRFTVINNTPTITIIEGLSSSIENKVLKHEQCHERQYLENRLYTCNNIVRLYFNEFECYALGIFD